MMFIASESIFEEIHKNFPNTIDYAARKKVFIVSPATLWATLNTIRAVLSDIKIKRVATQIKRELELLLTDLSRLNDRSENLSRHFAQTVGDIEQIKTSVGKITQKEK